MYYRVSTDKQDHDSQVHAVESWLAARGISDYQVFCDTASGSDDNRPEFVRMCSAIQNGDFNTVVAYRLDRISRKSVTALRLLIDWIQGGVAFYAVDTPALNLGHENPFRLTFAAMFAEIAQIERQTIIGRVKAGLRAAKARGVKLGADSKLTPEQLRIAQDMRRQGQSCRQVARQLGVSASTISRRT